MSRSLAACGMRVDAGEREQVVEAEHAVGSGPLEQQVQQVGGGERVVEGAVGRLVREPEATRERAEPAVRHLVAHEPAGQRARVDPRVATARPIRAPGAARREERRGRSARCGPTITVPAMNSTNAASTDSMRGRGHHHRLGDAGEHGDLGRDGHARVDERLERAEALAAADLDRADLGDRAAASALAPGGLEVDDAERDLGERGAEVVERALHGATIRRTGVREQEHVFDTAVIPVRCGAVEATRYRCTACGNLTRFDVVTSRRTSAFHHFTVAGELTIEDEQVLDEAHRIGHVPLVRPGGRGAGHDHRRDRRLRMIPNELIRDALEAALVVAIKDPAGSPKSLQPFLKFQKMPASAMPAVRKVLDTDDAFRERVAWSWSRSASSTRRACLFLDAAGGVGGRARAARVRGSAGRRPMPRTRRRRRARSAGSRRPRPRARRPRSASTT